MYIRDCMTKVVEMAHPGMFLSEAARMMKENNIGFLPVRENDRLVGTITDRDIVVRAVADCKDPMVTSVREVMSRKVLYCFDNQRVEEVAHNMAANRVRRLPVLNRDKNLVGVISLSDLSHVKTKSKRYVGEALHEISQPRVMEQSSYL